MTETTVPVEDISESPEVVGTQQITIKGLDEPVILGINGFVAYKAERAPSFNQTLKEEVKKDFQYRCMICGAGGVNAQEEIEIAHIMKHRGMGSLKSVNNKSNLGTLCHKCHNRHHNGKLKFIKFDPNDLEDGLIVEDGDGNRIPKDELYFYHLPTEDLKRLGWAEMQQFEREAKESTRHKWEALRHLANLKLQTKGRRPLFAGVAKDNSTEEYYHNWETFYKEKVKGELFENPKSTSTINQYISDVKVLPKLGEGWERVKFGCANNLASAVRDEGLDDGDLRELKTIAIQEKPQTLRDELARKRENKGIKTTDNCRKCEHKVELDPTKHNVSVGSKPIYVCYQFGQIRIIDSYTKSEARQTAENCSKYDQKKPN